MASKRRSGFRTPELRGTLGTLLRTTTGVVRDALERGAREGRARLDDVRASRRRNDALAELGELVLDLIRRGEIDLGELPEARDLVQQLDEIDAADTDDAPRPAHRNRFDERALDGRGSTSAGSAAEWQRGVVDGRGSTSAGSAAEWQRGVVDAPRADARARSPGTHGPWTRPAARARVDDERPIGSRPGQPDGEHIGRPDDDETLDGFHRRSAHDTDADGTVSSGAASRATRPTTPARPLAEPPSARAPTKPLKSLARRPDSESGGTALPTGPAASAAESAASRSRFPPTPHRKGGISFDEDDTDLADYMHPDDVPGKTTPKDGDHDA